MLSANSVSINSLRLKGDKRSCRDLVAELETHSWPMPFPEHLQRGWVLVRELHVKGKTRELRQQAAQQLNQTLQQAVQGGRNTANDNAIWFASLEEMIAFLLTDLAMAKTAQWYWKQWRHLLRYTQDEAIARMFCQYIEHIPAIVQQLIRTQQLKTVWTHLSHGAALTVAREIALTKRITFNFNESTSQINVPLPDEIITIREITQGNAFHQWKKTLAGLPANDGRVLLAAMIHGLTAAPIQMQRNAERCLNQLAAYFCLDNARNTDLGQRTIDESARRKDYSALQFGLPREAIEYKSAEGKITDHNIKFTSEMNVLSRSGSMEKEVKGYSTSNLIKDDQDSAVLRVFNHDESSDSNEEANQNSHLSAEAFADSMQKNGDELPYDVIFTTQSGGFFYLLSPLQQVISDRRLAEHQVSSAWHLLWDVCRVFAHHFNAVNRTIDEPLKQFFRTQIFPTLTDAERQSRFEEINHLSPVNLAFDAFNELADKFAAQEFWQALQRNASFFATPARVVASASHLDIYFPLSAVRLDLRLVAWDINPGWLPWLGRVVSFHYVESKPSTAEPSL